MLRWTRGQSSTPLNLAHGSTTKSQDNDHQDGHHHCSQDQYPPQQASTQLFPLAYQPVLLPHNHLILSYLVVLLTPETFAAWGKFTRCSIPDQSGDPSAFTVLTLTFARGYTDRFGRTGDVDYRFTMGEENQAWKITGVCDILSEGCYAVSWG